MANIKLISDFSDFYDVVFDPRGFEFRRVTTDGPKRREMFRMFRYAEIPTPLFGTVSELSYFLQDNDKIVLYKSECLHCGEGKVLMDLGFALDSKYHSMFACQFIPSFKEIAKWGRVNYSIRVLFIGDRAFECKYISYYDWRSNCGDGDIEHYKEIDPPKYRAKFFYPMFAIDFVERDGERFAIDLNVAPGLYGTGLHKVIAPSEIVLNIKNWYKSYFNG